MLFQRETGRKAGDLSKEIKAKYKYGFHVFFQPIIGNGNEVLFRTAEYIASGFFHNSQIITVDHEKKEVIFRYRNWVDRKTRKKSYANKKLDIYTFMARMLFLFQSIIKKTYDIMDSTGSPQVESMPNQNERIKLSWRQLPGPKL
jgi:hypothetical protein